MNKVSPSRAKMLSVVVPLYNEEGNVELLARRLHAVLTELPYLFELILVDDGSQDRTWRSISAIASRESFIQGYRLSRNFGHQHALLAGLHQASGDLIVSMDGDLQHPPEVIPELVTKWEQGFAIINTKRIDTAETPTFKHLTSKLFYKAFSALAEVDISEGTSDFRLLDRQVLQVLKQFKDSELFLRGAVQWLGFKSTVVPFRVDQRHWGASKYSLRRMLGFAVSAIISYSTKPLLIGIWFGLATSVVAFLELMYIMIQFYLGRTVPGWASTVGIISFLFGILFILLGTIGVYLAGIHKMLQSRPPFVIAEAIGAKQIQSAHVSSDD